MTGISKLVIEITSLQCREVVSSAFSVRFEKMSLYRIQTSYFSGLLCHCYGWIRKIEKITLCTNRGEHSLSLKGLCVDRI